MASGAGFTVDPAELKKFSQYLSNTTQPAVQDAANRMQAANGFDNAAFGILLAQVLAVPSRITMGVITDEIRKLAGDIGQSATDVQKAADAYSAQDSSAAQGLGTFHTELGQ
ncbi:hypothetical protein FHX82_004528 [Amycolatopsis bartoniae]|uniref:ESX-1 secretion-associated protein n=1 Tax=Amycolatopsis bartoniae TaxID=941986 RepID=A0A8H9IZ31_9PSEU|nr:hypothetical protein [Amycolatopsis bartoniae]MBB2937455.1 hypothetical protein [Amycolatopsis bartoniae]TVS99105.1 hypothetical protein FNH07_35795 [Amycolatopsis bartoniae]GHF86882.1 hypothetical protein GCM10017566_70940 [Amycolatopsis bartoniae]